MEFAIAIVFGFTVVWKIWGYLGRKAQEPKLRKLAIQQAHRERLAQQKIEVVETKDDGSSDMLTPMLTESYLTLQNYVGQKKNVEYLKGHINKSKASNKPLPHVIMWGSGGLGKSTLMKAAATEMGGRFFELMPANLRTSKELFGIMFKKKCRDCGYNNPYSTNKCLSCKSAINVYFEPVCQFQDKDVLFLEECHGLKDEIEETLYSLMQDGYMIIRYDGVDRRFEFPNITIAGATTQLGQLNKPFRDRFKVQLKLQHYSKDEIKTIVSMYAKSQKLVTTPDGLDLIAKISHGTPRIAKKYVSDTATISNEISAKNIKIVMELLNVDDNGLDDTHIKGMQHILERMKTMRNGGAGSTSIASSVGIPKSVWEELYEPALLYQDLIFMGSKGRRLTSKALDDYFFTEKNDVRE